MMNQSRIAEKWQPFLPVIVALVVAVSSGVVLRGWLVGVDQFTILTADQVSMKANTALGFLICAALLLVAPYSTNLIAKPLRWLLAAALLLMSTLTLGQYIFGVQLDIDELLVNAPSHEYLTASPGRMAPTTAACFILFSIALIFDHWQSSVARGWSRVTATLLMLTALASLLGYAYEAPALYLGVDGVTAMSLLSALLFLLLAVGVIWLRPEFGFPAMLSERSVVGAHIRALLPMVVGAPLLVGAAVAAGYGRLYEGEFAIALTALGSLMAAGLIAIVSIVILRRAEAELYIKDRALAAATGGIVITDHRHPNEPIVFINSAFETITGYEATDIIGRNCRFLNAGVDNPAEMLDELRACIASESSGTFELENRRSDGSRFWNRLSLAPVEDFEGKITHFVGVVDDITDKRRQASQLENALAEARHANSMRNTFVRLVSHELRTPLNAALTWIRLLEVDDDPATRKRGLDVIAKSVNSQSRLIDDLVDVTRFATAGVRLETTTADIGELVESAIEELRPMMESDHEVTLRIAEGNFSATVDPLRVRQIVQNIVTNAGKYTPTGGRIDIALGVTDACAVLTVTDNGSGLSTAQIRHVFEPFWRAESHQPGLGVGLSIVASLVAAHEGTIDVESAGPGQGCTFTVKLPLSGPGNAPASVPVVPGIMTARDDSSESPVDACEDVPDYSDGR